MLALDVSADVARVSDFLSNLARRHVPHAAAKALTRTAFDARDAVRESLPERFNLRRPWISKGIGITPAQPRTLMAAVWSRDRFMALQESGGTKANTSAIPVGPMAQLAQTRVIPRSHWPGKMLAKQNAFYRDGTVFKRKNNRRIEGLFLMRRQQAVAPRLGMAETVRSAALSEFRRQMERALRQELTNG